MSEGSSSGPAGAGQPRKISARLEAFNQSASSSSSSSASGAARPAPKSGSLKDRIAMFNQSADAPVPVPPTEFGLRVPPASAASSGSNRGLYGNRIPSFGTAGANIPSGPPAGRRVVENRGLIGNRIPSVQLDGRSPTSSEGEVPAPKTPSSAGVQPAKSEAAPASAAAARIDSPQTPEPGIEASGAGEDSPSTPKSTISEPPSRDPTLDDVSDVQSEDRNSVNISRTTSSLSVAGGAADAVPSSLYVESDTSSRQPMQDVSGVSTPTGTPKMSRLELAEDPAGDAPAGVEAAESRYKGIGLGVQKMDLNDPSEKLAADADVEDLVVPREEAQADKEASATADNLATPSAEPHEFVNANDLVASGSIKVPVDIEEAEETEAVMAGDKVKGAEEAAVPIEVESAADEAVDEKPTGKGKDVVKDAAGLSGKQVEIEPVPFVAPRDGEVEPAPSADSAPPAEVDEDKPPSSKISQSDFPSVPHDDLDQQQDQHKTPLARDSASGSNTPIDPNFLKSFPSVPVEDGNPATELGSPDQKVRVEVHVASSPSASKVSKAADTADALSPRVSLDSAASDSGSPSAIKGRRASPSPAPRTAIEDAEDDGEGGWAKVEVKKKR